MIFFINLFLLFILFNDIFLHFIELPHFFYYWDEGLFLLLFIYSCLCYFNNKFQIKTTDKKIIFLLTVVVIFGILGNIVFQYTTNVGAIFRDIVNFLKFPLSYLLIDNLKIVEYIDNHINELTFKILKAIIILIFMCGIISLFIDIGMSQSELRLGIHPYLFLFSHPTYLVLSHILLLSLIESYGFEKKEVFLYEILILINVCLSMRTKGIVVVALYIFIKYFGKLIEKYKKIYVSLLFLIALVVASSKILLYLSWESSPREVLYLGCIMLAIHCFPIGSGFATFSSHLSWQCKSKVYSFIEIPFYYENGSIQTAVLGDAGFPYYLGQFGLFGFILTGAVYIMIYRKSLLHAQRKVGLQLLCIYVIVALTSESILMNNGVEIGIILSLCSLISKRKKYRC